MSIFGDMFRLWMAAEGHTMTKVARDVGISKSTLSRICAGYEPDAQTLIKLINYLWAHE